MIDVSVARLIDQINALPPIKRKAVMEGLVDGPQPLKATKGQKVVVWHGLPVIFVPGQYLSKPQQIWQLDAILGPAKVKRALKQTQMVLDSQIVERLFSQSTVAFFTNSSQTYLLSTKNELTEADFGPLQRISALDALKRFGLELLEATKEKGYVRLAQR